MTTTVRTMLESIEALSDADRQEAAAEILRRVARSEDELTDEAFMEAADTLFCLLDAEEAANASP